MPLHVLFLCTGNSARSILAEALLNYRGGGQVRAFSAGSRPAGAVHPMALQILQEYGVPADGLRSKSWDEFGVTTAPAMDVVITVCDNAAKETCPIWPGAPVSAHWGIKDPVAVKGTDADQRRAFVRAFRELDARVEAFLRLPFDTLDRALLKRELDAIGRMTRR